RPRPASLRGPRPAHPRGEYRNAVCRGRVFLGRVTPGTQDPLPPLRLVSKSARVGHGSVTVVCQNLWYHRRARFVRAFLRMPNIKQQKKRVRTSAEDRGENLRYRSTVKTITRRAAAAVGGRDKARVAAGATA